MLGFATLSVISASALRVASLDLCADEYLLLLGRPAEIASISRVGHDPGDSLLWRRAQGFPANDGSIESLVGSRPTVALSSGGGGRSTRSLAGALGIRVVTLPYPASAADVAANMRQVASLLGDAHRADWWLGRLSRLEARLPPPRDSIFLASGGSSVAPGSVGADWMRLAGFHQRALPGGRATLELLATDPPQRLLQSTYRAGQASLGQRWLDHPLLRRLATRRVMTDGRPWTCAGPMMLFEIERLRAAR